MAPLPTHGLPAFCSAGQVDQFVLTCADVGAVEAVNCRHLNDGTDWQSSRWKLQEIAVTRLATSDLPTPGQQSPAVSVQSSSTRRANVAWSFVPGPGAAWLSVDPADTIDLDSRMEEAIVQIEAAKELIFTLEAQYAQDEAERWEVVKRSVAEHGGSIGAVMWPGSSALPWASLGRRGNQVQDESAAWARAVGTPATLDRASPDGVLGDLSGVALPVAVGVGSVGRGDEAGALTREPSLLTQFAHAVAEEHLSPGIG